MEKSIEVSLHGKILWIYERNLEAGQGPLMPTPDHAQETFGMGDSYAHLFPDGNIRRHKVVIGTIEDLERV